MRNKTRLLLTIAILFISSAIVFAGGVKFENDKGHYMKLGGRLQLQYYVEDPDGGDTTDKLLLRRLRPYIEGSVHENWLGKFQWDMGKGKIALQDVYMQYMGLAGWEIKLGNTDFIFSREFLTSNKYQTMVERTLIGSSSYGTPHRQTGLHVKKHVANKKIFLCGAATIAAFDPDNKKVKWQSAIQLDPGDDWSQGPMVGARIELNPMGPVKWSQGDFERGDSKISLGFSAYYWSNDDDNISELELDETGSPVLGYQDLETCTAAEVDLAYRGHGLSIDIEYNVFDIDLVRGGVTDGLYEDSGSTLANFSAEGGYMIVPSKLELGAAYQAQDADGYDKTWTRTSAAINYYVKKHDIKYQLTYRINKNKDGIDGKDVNETFIQAQYVF